MFSNQSNSCAVSSALYFFSVLPLKVHQLEYQLRLRASGRTEPLLDLHQVFLWLAQLNPFLSQLVDYDNVVKIRPGQLIQIIRESSTAVLVEINRYKDPTYKLMLLHDYQLQLRTEGGRYQLSAVLYHSGTQNQDGHFWTKVKREDVWVNCDGGLQTETRLERGSRAAVKLLYKRVE